MTREAEFRTWDVLNMRNIIKVKYLETDWLADVIICLLSAEIPQQKIFVAFLHKHILRSDFYVNWQILFF